MFKKGSFKAEKETKVVREAGKLNYNFRQQPAKDYTEMDDDSFHRSSPDYKEDYMLPSCDNSPTRKKKAVTLINTLTNQLEIALFENETEYANRLIKQISDLNNVAKNTNHNPLTHPISILKNFKNEEEAVESDMNDYHDYIADEARKDHNPPQKRISNEITQYFPQAVKKDPIQLNNISNTFPHRTPKYDDDLTNDEKGISNYTWQSLKDTTPIISDSSITIADYFKNVNSPYNFDLLMWNKTKNVNTGWQHRYTDKFIPDETEIHENLNRLRDYCQNENKHIYEWGSQIYSGLIFSKIPAVYTAFERLRSSQSKKFIEPGKMRKDDLQGICRWIEAMYKEILLKWRVPRTSDGASDWLKNAKLPTNDFTELRSLVEDIRKYTEHLDNWIEGRSDENLILKQVKSALRQTDNYFGVQKTNPQSLSMQFQFQYKLYNTTSNASENEKELILNQTCIALTAHAKAQEQFEPKKKFLQSSSNPRPNYTKYNQS
jgi:hypothetical protein